MHHVLPVFIVCYLIGKTVNSILIVAMDSNKLTTYFVRCISLVMVASITYIGSYYYQVENYETYKYDLINGKRKISDIQLGIFINELPNEPEPFTSNRIGPSAIDKTYRSHVFMAT